jgi:hypothetical protein
VASHLCQRKDRTVVEEQISFTAFSPADLQIIYPTSVCTKKSFNLATDNLDILTVKHLGIVPGLDVCDL